jgi:hypothetical protein
MKNSTSVTATLIVRNEELRIADCLSSIQNAVDEILVVDTGSSDSTVSIAKGFGARTASFHWIDDFSAARNFALELCKTEWTLYIDADERLAASSRRPLKEEVSADWLAADVRFQPRVNYTRYRLARLFRVDPRIRFRGSIHETILPSVHAASEPNRPAIGLTEVRMDHIGYEGDLVAKHHRNLPLLEKCVLETPQRVFYWFHLTETLLGLNRLDEALEAGFTGIETGERAAAVKDRIDAAMICQMLGATMLDKGDDPIALLRRGMNLHPENFGLRLTLARRELRFGDLRLAVEIARALQSVDPDSLKPGLVAYDRGIFGRYAIEMEIAGLARLGKTTEAAALAARKALILASGGMPTGGADQR